MHLHDRARETHVENRSIQISGCRYRRLSFTFDKLSATSSPLTHMVEKDQQCNGETLLSQLDVFFFFGCQWRYVLRLLTWIWCQVEWNYDLSSEVNVGWKEITTKTQIANKILTDFVAIGNCCLALLPIKTTSAARPRKLQQSLTRCTRYPTHCHWHLCRKAKYWRTSRMAADPPSHAHRPFVQRLKINLQHALANFQILSARFWGKTSIVSERKVSKKFWYQQRRTPTTLRVVTVVPPKP